MADFPTYSDLAGIARDEALLRSERLTREVIERRGSDANALVHSSVAVGDALVGQLIALKSAMFLNTAKKADLDRLVFDRYQLTRKAASPSLATVTITTATPCMAGFTINIGTPFKTNDGKVFNAIEQVIFPPGSSGPITVMVQSLLAGSDQVAKVRTINKIDLSTAPSDISVINLEASIGGSNEETDSEFRSRAQLVYPTLHRGTLAAIQRKALEVPGVNKAIALEVLDSSANPARLVEVVITDRFTEQLIDATVIPAGYQTQAEALALKVKSALLDTRAAGIQVIVRTAKVFMLSVTLLVRYRDGSDPITAANAARAKTVAYINSLSPGQSFVKTELQAMLETIPGLLITGGEIISPETDLTSKPLMVWRTSSSMVLVGN